MKAMAIRLVENKDQVMVLFGGYADWNEEELFWRIDECTDPNECEYIEFEIDKFSLGFMWASQGQDIGCVDLNESTTNHLLDVFEGEYEWIKINIDVNYK